MATELYKDGASQMFQANRVQGALASGWSVSAEDTEAHELDEEELRAMAKERGIGHYWNKSIDNLKEELGL